MKVYKDGLKLHYSEKIESYKISIISKYLMSRYDLDKISKLRIRNQNIFNEVISDKIEVLEFRTTWIRLLPDGNK